ncbi:MAG: hypothetical protein KJ947_20780 [Alphaproteobacteria bacterium]|jgi:hypothetical protein|nr:hypothetical protein [Alphaproteobacteria bacterium]MBU1551984.1 hypothetical protein [Alphaproteobacteria bacterium]MBU2337531.1 hypothetical protein [Alphaproteobacteria bacterium]MBU2388172.1 hypothetical protein [Alphaproteobacteria bacterium]
MTKFSLALAATFASISFATVAVAQEGTYYEGIGSQSRNGAQGGAARDYGHTGSIARAHDQAPLSSPEPTLNSGDYYQGAARPQ